MRGKLPPSNRRGFAFSPACCLPALEILNGLKNNSSTSACQLWTQVIQMNTRMNTDLIQHALTKRAPFERLFNRGAHPRGVQLIWRFIKTSLFALGCAGLFPVLAQTSLPSPAIDTGEDTLQAVRSSLVKLAMEGPTQVKSTSWIDEDGTLRDSAEFTNEMVVRGVRILAYTHDSDSQAEVSLEAKKEGVALSKSCKSQNAKEIDQLKGIQHLVVFDVGIAPQIKFQDLYVTRLIAKSLKENLLAQSDESRIFKMSLNALPSDSVTLSGVNANKATLQAVFPSSINAYQQALLGRGDQRVTWQASLYLEPTTDEITQAPGLKVSTVLQNRLDKRQTMTFEENLWFESTPQKSYSSVLSSVMSAQVNAVAKSIERSMESELACIPPQFEVTKWQGQQLVLAAGSMNGLKSGDQFVVVDPSILPAHALQAGAMQRMVLAEVKHVSPYTAELKQVAGPALSGNANWVAVAHAKP